jgi:hypothetical protein
MVTGHLAALALLSLAVPTKSVDSKVSARTVPLDEFVGLLVSLLAACYIVIHEARNTDT